MLAGAGRWVAGVLVVLGLGFGSNYFAERDVRSEIEDQNSAASSGGGSGAGGSRTQQGMSVFDLRTGDCFREGGAEEVGTVDLVACSDPSVMYRVTYLFAVPDSETLPSMDAFDMQAAKQCPSSTDTFLYPLADGWALGDRTITCIEFMD